MGIEPRRPRAERSAAAALVLALATAFCAAHRAAAQTAPPPHLPGSLSTSRQFVVYAATPQERAALATTAEEIKSRLRRLLGLPQSWRVTVSIVASRARLPEDPTSARFRVTGTEAGPLIRVEITAGREPDNAAIRGRLVEAVLADIALSGPAAAEWRTLSIPAWLTEGFLGLLDLPDSGHPAGEAFAGLFESGRMPPLAQFLEQDASRLDPSARQLYRGMAVTLVRLLLEGETGRADMVRFIESLPTGKLGGLRSLASFFPRLGGTPESAQKWWALASARAASRLRGPALSVAETDTELSQALLLRVPGQDGKIETRPFTEAASLRRDRRRREILQETRLALQRTALRAHPLMQPVVLGYLDLAGRAVKGDFKRFEAKAAELESLRAEIRSRAAQIADYLNWFEATQIPEPSGAFKGYFDLLKQLSAEERPRRDDPVSTYLDRMEIELR